MSDHNNLNHTNDVPISSIKDRSPALWGVLKRSLSEQDCKLVDDLFLLAVKCNGNNELIKRESGVTFNARLARVIQIVAETIQLTIPLISKCLAVSCPNPNEFLQLLNTEFPNIGISNVSKDDNETLIALSAAKLDELRHLHLSLSSQEQLVVIIDGASTLSQKLNLPDDSKLKIQLTSAINRTKQRLLL